MAKFSNLTRSGLAVALVLTLSACTSDQDNGGWRFDEDADSCADESCPASACVDVRLDEAEDSIQPGTAAFLLTNRCPSEVFLSTQPTNVLRFAPVIIETGSTSRMVAFVGDNFADFLPGDGFITLREGDTTEVELSSVYFECIDGSSEQVSIQPEELSSWSYRLIMPVPKYEKIHPPRVFDPQSINICDPLDAFIEESEVVVTEPFTYDFSAYGPPD